MHYTAQPPDPLLQTKPRLRVFRVNNLHQSACYLAQWWKPALFPRAPNELNTSWKSAHTPSMTHATICPGSRSTLPTKPHNHRKKIRASCDKTPSRSRSRSVTWSSWKSFNQRFFNTQFGGIPAMLSSRLILLLTAQKYRGWNDRGWVGPGV